MKKIIIIVTLMMLMKCASSQVKIFGDSTLIYSGRAGSVGNELRIKDSTRQVFSGILTNIDGNGATKFMRPHMLDSAHIVIGFDTFFVGGGSGSPFYRYAIEDRLGIQNRFIDYQNFRLWTANMSNLKTTGTNTTNGDVDHDRFSQFLDTLSSGDATTDRYPRGVISEVVTSGNTDFDSPDGEVVALQGQLKLNAHVTTAKGWATLSRVWGFDTNFTRKMIAHEAEVTVSSMQTAEEVAGVRSMFMHQGGSLITPKYYAYDASDSNRSAAPTDLIGVDTSAMYHSHNFDIGNTSLGFWQEGITHPNIFEGESNYFYNLPGYSSGGSNVVVWNNTTKRIELGSIGSDGGSETDPIANAKTITENDGYGLNESSTATQALSTNPSWSRSVDTFAIETRARGLKIIDSLHSLITSGGASPWNRNVLSGASSTLNIVQTNTLSDTVVVGGNAAGIISGNAPRSLFNVGGTSWLNGQVTISNATNPQFKVLSSTDGRGLSLFYDGAGHGFTFAPVGAGTGTDVTFSGLGIVCNALNQAGSLGLGALGQNLQVINNGGISTSTNNTALVFGGSTNVQMRMNMSQTVGATISPSTNYGGFIIGSNPVTESTSGTTPLLANLVIRPLSITNGAATTTDASTLYIEGPPTGITPTNTATAMWINNGVVKMTNTTSVPASQVSGTILFYADGGEFKVRDDAGNVTTLSPHDPHGLPGGLSNKMAWSYHSERNGNYIAVDMYKAVKQIEKQDNEIEELKKEIAELKGMIYHKKKPVKLIYTGKTNKK